MDKETNRTIASRDVKIFENGNIFCNTNVDNKYFEYIADESSESEESDCDELTVAEPMTIIGVQHGQDNRAKSDAADQSNIDGANETLTTTATVDNSIISVDAGHNSTMVNDSNETVYDDAIDDSDFEPDETVIPMGTPRRSGRETRPVQIYEAVMNHKR